LTTHLHYLTISVVNPVVENIERLGQLTYIIKIHALISYSCSHISLIYSIALMYVYLIGWKWECYVIYWYKTLYQPISIYWP